MGIRVEHTGFKVVCDEWHAVIQPDREPGEGDSPTAEVFALHCEDEAVYISDAALAEYLRQKGWTVSR